MANEEVIQSDNSAVAENTSEAVETTGTQETVTTQVEEKVDFNKPVTSSSEAHKVLEAQKELQAKNKVAEKPKSDNSENDFVPRKQYLEIQKLANKHDRELNELRKFHQEYQAKERKLVEQQEQLQIQQMMQQNPQEAYREIARREAFAQVAPVQDALYQAQAVNINSQIQGMLGEKYSEYAPVMAELIDKFEQIDAYNSNNPDPNQRTKYAQDLSNNPVTLIEMAKKEFEAVNKTKAVNISEQRKSDNLRIASGVAKKSNVKSEAVDNFKNLSLSEMTQHMKSMGLIKK